MSVRSARAVVARLMMFDALVVDLVAQAPQEVILVVVRGAEQRAGLLHQLAVLREDVRRHCQGRVAVGRQVQIHGGRAAQCLGLEIAARQHGRIDQGGERHLRELNVIAAAGARAGWPARGSAVPNSQPAGRRRRAVTCMSSDCTPAGYSISSIPQDDRQPHRSLAAARWAIGHPCTEHLEGHLER